MLFPKFLAQRRAHVNSSDAGGCGEVGFAALAPRGGNGWFVLASEFVHNMGESGVDILLLTFMVTVVVSGKLGCRVAGEKFEMLLSSMFQQYSMCACRWCG